MPSASPRVTREVPIVVLSSKEEPATKAEAFGLGANDYLVKLPDRLELDISSMTIGDSLRVSDIVLPGSVRLLDDPESVVVTVTPPTKVEEPEPEEAEEAVEGEEALEGEGEAPEAEGDEGDSGGEEPAEG